LLTLHTLASGSEGNSLLLSEGDTHLLVDAGISHRRICRALEQLALTVDDLSAILITHEHSDHIAGLRTLVKRHRLPLFASAPTARQLEYRVAGAGPLLRTVESGESWEVGACRVTAFATSHDAAGSLDYRVDSAGGSAGVLTDTGYVTDEAAEALRGVALLVLESNHDVDMLRAGPYPYPLKQRILGPRGHLCNEAAAEFAAEMARWGTGQFVLAHLSAENNTPLRAEDAVRRALAAAGYEAGVAVAPRRELSACFRAEEAVCRR
jgi:phosphoribosyl 1,2-cyclic phosphodiesterase